MRDQTVAAEPFARRYRNPLVEFLSHLRSLLWMIPILALATLVFGSVSLLASFFDGTGRLQHKVAQSWGRFLLRIFLVEVVLTGHESLEPDQVYVFASNHFSLIDTPLMFGHMPREFRILARHGLWRIPFLGWHLNRAGHIPVNRENPREAARNIGQAADKLNAEGNSILIFPEGRRTRIGKMMRFKPGAAYIAIKAGVPIVPMAIAGTRDILAPGSSHLHPGRAVLRFGQPIPTQGLVNRDASGLIKRVQAEVARLAGVDG